MKKGVGIRPSVPHGYCECGCGRMAPIATVSRRRDGWVKGQPLRFIRGHSNCILPQGSVAPPNPSGLCLCGCGKKTRIATHNVPTKNIVAGEPLRYLTGHHTRAVKAESRIVNVDGRECRTVPLTRGLEAIVDIADWPNVAQHSWCAIRGYGNTWYAQTRIASRLVTLHSFLLPVAEGLTVDHENGNGLDCRRSNMREATYGQNNHNRRQSSPHKLSQYLGVTFDRQARSRPWRAQLKVNERNEYLGSFASEEDAARARDKRAREHYGHRARLNFPS